MSEHKIERGTPREGAAMFMAFLERLDWRFSVDDAGRLTVIIGDDPPKLTQPQVLAALSALSAECVELLSDRAIH
jgi:hypothetical protein